jgi:hypothetical protein
MSYIIRANPAPSAKGKPEEPPTYWVPRADGSYSRTGNRSEAAARGFATRAAAIAYMEGQGVKEGAAHEVTEA